jgi:hypothetical protein
MVRMALYGWRFALLLMINGFFEPFLICAAGDLLHALARRVMGKGVQHSIQMPQSVATVAMRVVRTYLPNIRSLSHNQFGDE